MRRMSLWRRVALTTSLGFLIIWFLAILTAAFVITREQKQFSDMRLREIAETLHPVLTRLPASAPAARATPTRSDARSLRQPRYALFDPQGRVLLHSAGNVLDAQDLNPLQPGFQVTDSHVYYVTAPDAAGKIVAFGDSRQDRTRVLRRGFIAFALPMLALLPLVYLSAGWIARASLSPVDRLRGDLGRRNEKHLDPINVSAQPKELRGITNAVNSLMQKLQEAVERERAFATNAAHELRTPVAIALAQAQQLQGPASDEVRPGLQRIETALQRMGKLVTRLLQLARADQTQTPRRTDVCRLIPHVLDGAVPDANLRSRIDVTLPPRPVWAFIDPDSFAILTSVLIDNALRHSPDASRICIEVDAAARIIVRNECSPMTDAELASLKTLYQTSKGHRGGFGIGLHIAETIARQAGGHLTLRAPQPGRSSGFEARYDLPAGPKL